MFGAAENQEESNRCRLGTWNKFSMILRCFQERAATSRRNTASDDRHRRCPDFAARSPLGGPARTSNSGRTRVGDHGIDKSGLSHRRNAGCGYRAFADCCRTSGAAFAGRVRRCGRCHSQLDRRRGTAWAPRFYDDVIAARGDSMFPPPRPRPRPPQCLSHDFVTKADRLTRRLGA
jgi:hypothetical protein